MQKKQLVRNPDLIAAPTGPLFPLSYENEYLAEEYRAFIEKNGGFDPWNATLTPMGLDDEEIDLVHCMSSIAGALEAGQVHKTEWPSQLFGSDEALERFYVALSDHPERLSDRHFRALSMISGNFEATSNEELAESFREAADAEHVEAIQATLKSHGVI